MGKVETKKDKLQIVIFDSVGRVTITATCPDFFDSLEVLYVIRRMLNKTQGRTVHRN